MMNLRSKIRDLPRILFGFSKTSSTRSPSFRYMECQECGNAQPILVLHHRNTFNVYDIQCNLCRRHYCGLCGLSSHFPALCRERILWQEYFINRDGNFLAIYDHMLANTIARRNMDGWRNQIGPEFDTHQHMRFAVEELSRISNIHTWARVVAHFSVDHVALLQSEQFERMINAHKTLFNQFTASMNAQPPLFELGLARIALCDSACRFLSLLRSTRNAQAIVYPGHVNQEMVNYNMNFDRALAMWLLYSLR